MAVRSVLAIALAACALTACSAADDPPPDEADLAWHACGDAVAVETARIPAGRLEELTFACAELTVPVDHADPDGDTLDMAVVRFTTGGDKVGSLVMNPGGPGQPGLDYAPFWASWLPDELLDSFDVVTFDPRGVGASHGVNCPPLPEDERPGVIADISTAQGWADLVDVNDRFATGCLDELGELTAFLNTEATARDLDLLREALGDERLTYLGFSYGAGLGGEYARQFPDRVRALALDAPGDPLADELGVITGQVQGFEESFAAYADACADRPSCAEIGDPERFVLALTERANTNPIQSLRPGDTHPAGGGDVMGGVIALLYDEARWPDLDAALLEAEGGDAGSLFEAYENLVGPDEPGRPSASDANWVINCNDRPPGPSDAEMRAAARRILADNPVMGPVGSTWVLACHGWPVERHVLARPAAPTADPILVIGTVGDPATPYEGAVRFTEALGGSGLLLTWEGEGHTAYGQSDCVTRAVDRYLIDLELPAEGARCPA